MARTGKGNARVMNPADKERKKQRLQELKRNKKQRTAVRQAIVKGRDPEELLEHLRKLDEQEFDIDCDLSQHVISEKRSKYRGAYIQQLSLYRQEKDSNQVTRLENMLHDYEKERLRKEQQFQAQKFADDSNLGEIPLPTGSMEPNAAMTPFMPLPPQPPRFHQSVNAVKDGAGVKINKKPPGPPCGMPPELDDDISRTVTRRVHFVEDDEPVDDYDVDDDDLAPVTMPDSLLPPKSVFQPVRSLISAPPIAPGMMPPPPPQMPPPAFARYNEPPQAPPSYQPLPYADGDGQATYSQPPTRSASSGATVISAEPQMRNLKKEATRFLPTSLQVSRPTIGPVRTGAHPPSATAASTKAANSGGASKNARPTRSADEACDEFLREISDLL